LNGREALRGGRPGLGLGVSEHSCKVQQAGIATEKDVRSRRLVVVRMNMAR
jgi:hypothetical protein